MRWPSLTLHEALPVLAAALRVPREEAMQGERSDSSPDANNDKNHTVSGPARGVALPELG